MKNSIKKTISIMLAVVLLLTAAPLSGFVGLKINLDLLDFSTKSSALAATGQCGENVYWTFDESSGALTISGTGKMNNYDDRGGNDSPFWDTDSIKSVFIESGITSIGDWLFCGCEILSITIPDSVTNIGEAAFLSCTGLTSITIPDSVTSIGSSAFYNTGYYNDSLNWENGVLYIGNHLIKANTSCSGAYIIKSGTKSIPDSAFYGCTGLTSVTIPDSVTSISDYAFFNCTGLTSITIPNSVSNIGSYSFVRCTGLTSITIPDNVTSIGIAVFSGCTSLTNVTISDSVTSIGEYAFPSDTVLICKNQYSLDYAKSGNYMYQFVPEDGDYIITANVTNKLSYTLDQSTGTLTINCDGAMPSFQSQDAPWLQYINNIFKIVVNEGCTKISYNAFKNMRMIDVAMPETLNTIGSYSFSGCKRLPEVTIPDSVTSIGSYAFYDCTGFTSITIDNSVTSIGDSVFEDCTGLTSVTIGNSVTSIGDSAFRDCTGLTSVTISDSVTSIGNYAFLGCTGLTSIIIPGSVTSISKSAFYGCTGLTSVTIPDSVTSIKEWAFKGCTYLKELTMPCSVSYSYSAFDYTCIEKLTLTVGSGMMMNYSSSSYDETPWYYNRNNIKSITLEEGITSIGSYAFYECSKVNISIPSTVTSIGNYAFYGCTTMEDVVLSENVQSIGASSFANVKTIKVYNRNCTFGADCIPFSATVYGYAGSTAEAFANENGYNFEYLGEGHEHLYDNNCDTVCNICGFTRTVTHTYDNDCDDTCNICGAKRTPNHHYSWITIKNPTTTEEGLAQKKCTVCGYVAEEFTMPMLVADFVTGIALSPKTIALNVGETADITAIVTPETAQNKNIIWSSTDSENVTVSNGTVTAVRYGYAFIIAETEDGGYKDFCHVRVIGITAANGSVVDSDSGLIYGLAPKLSSIDRYIDPLDETLSVVCDDAIIGTGSVIQVLRNGEPVDTYQAVIFGDVSSDGIYDGQDSFIVNCIANGLVTREQIGEAKYLAADCNHDGEVNSLDVAILEQSGLLLSQVDQTKEDYAETDAYAEYLDLIDQNPSGEDDTPETPEESQPTVIERIIDLFVKAVAFIRSLFMMIRK